MEFDELQFEKLMKEMGKNPNLKISLEDWGMELKDYSTQPKTKINHNSIVVRIKNRYEVKKQISLIYGNIRIFCDKYGLGYSNVYNSIRGELINYLFLDILLNLKIQVELEFYKKKEHKKKERERIL